MPTFRTLQPVPFTADEGHAAVAALAAAAGVAGVYVQNALAAGDGQGVLLLQKGEPFGLGWFGVRGNLVVLAPDNAPGPEFAQHLQATGLPWRIAMGPAVVIDALRATFAGKPLVHRDQLYCAGDASSALAGPPLAVRPAEPADRERLLQATLQLNHADLNLDPRRVDRRWLRDSIEERIHDGTTLVSGPPGGFQAKLDIGSDGPHGRMLEGVFTFPEARGQGLATALVAHCLRLAPGRVCLHVGQHNQPARRAYLRAGMAEVARCRLLLLG